MKQDRRLVRSKARLYDALMELMQLKNYHDISITELTKKSDIARQSFYRIHDSKDDILLCKIDEIHKNIFEKSEMEFDQENDIFLDLVISKLVNAFKEKEAFFSALLNAGLQHKALNKFAECIAAYSEKNNNQKELDIYQEYQIHFIVGGIYMVLFKWNQCNMSTPIESIIAIMQESSKQINFIIDGN